MFWHHHESASDANTRNDPENLKSGKDTTLTNYTNGLSLFSYSSSMLSSLKTKLQLHEDEQSDIYGWLGPY